MKIKDIELLAPAGDAESFYAAINSGADAVYLGLQGYNARARAENFNVENIEYFVNYAHLRGVKVYFTVNTLVKDKEFDGLEKTVDAAVAAGVDAYIVQDTGVALYLKTRYKGIELHASTQLGVHNLRGAKVAEKAGFSRVVLARETKLADIVEIKKNTGLEIEFFAQGALCVAFSGNCYLSSFDCGESGNRGRCAQLCRERYTDSGCGKSGYLLSTRDLCLQSSVAELAAAGITCLKIEGRLRRAGYVAVTTQCYRRAIDGEVQKEDRLALLRAFSRGEFNERAYLDTGTPKNVINPAVSAHLGTKIGSVLSVKPFKNIYEITLKSSHTLTSGDGLKILSDGEVVASLGVGNVDKLKADTYKIYSKAELAAGEEVYLILDALAEAQALNAQKKTAVNLTVTALADQPLSASAVALGCTAQITANFVPERAEKSPATAEDVAVQFGKTGDTPFVAVKTDVETDGVFLPKSVLNALRRDLLAALEREIVTAKRPRVEIADNKPKTVNADIAYKSIIVTDYIDETVLNGAKTAGALLALSPINYDKDFILEQQKTAEQADVPFALRLFTVANGKDIALLDGIIDSLSTDTVLIAENLYGLSYSDTHKVIAGTGLNVFNAYAKTAVVSLGACGVVLSVEQSAKCYRITDEYVYAVGAPALMTFAHCPAKTVTGKACAECGYFAVKGYTDRRGRTYPIRRTVEEQCYFELLSDKTVNNTGEKFRLYADLRGLSPRERQTALTALTCDEHVEIRNGDTCGKLFTEIN